MSFSSDVKKELAGKIPGARHCQIAELAALVTFCGTVRGDENNGRQIFFETEHADVADQYALLLRKIFRFPEPIAARTVKKRKKTDLYEIAVRDPDAAAKILSAIRLDEEDSEGARGQVPLVHRVILQRSCCRKSFLRGAFLSAGSVSDPDRSYHFEIACADRQLAGELLELIRSLGIGAKVVERKKYSVVYAKESEDISDLLGMMGATRSLLAFENTRVVRGVRGDVNRKVNCETANIEKTASAAAWQIEDIKLIEETVGFSKISNGLDEIARIRLQYPTATLAELGARLDPPVGKSGVNHRLRKLGRIADDIRVQGGSVHDGQGYRYDSDFKRAGDQTDRHAGAGGKSVSEHGAFGERNKECKCQEHHGNDDAGT